MTGGKDEAPRNRLLQCLPRTELQLVRGSLQPVRLEQGTSISPPGSKTSWVYFPENAMITLVAIMSDGRSVAAGVVGREGMTGMSAFFGVPTDPFDWLVQVPGDAYRMPFRDLRELTGPRTKLCPMLLRYASSFQLQIAQGTACNALHPIPQRFARWLLVTADHVGAPTFRLTQDFLAQMLGVRRPGVTIAADALRRRGLISYSRGRITILNRAGLRTRACECYRVLRAEFDRHP
jgi:CRP-like cAMP-binding protein